MGDRLGVVVRSAERLGPLRGEKVVLRAPGAWDLGIGDLADKSVTERVLALTGNSGRAMAAEQLPPVEPMENPPYLVERDGCDCSEREIRSTLHYLEKWLRLSREMNDEGQLRKLKPIKIHHNSVASIAQHHKGECECATNS